jgi:hypothetical protein
MYLPHSYVYIYIYIYVYTIIYTYIYIQANYTSTTTSAECSGRKVNATRTQSAKCCMRVTRREGGDYVSCHVMLCYGIE